MKYSVRYCKDSNLIKTFHSFIFTFEEKEEKNKFHREIIMTEPYKYKKHEWLDFIDKKYYICFDSNDQCKIVPSIPYRDMYANLIILIYEIRNDMYKAIDDAEKAGMWIE